MISSNSMPNNSNMLLPRNNMALAMVEWVEWVDSVVDLVVDLVVVAEWEAWEAWEAEAWLCL